MDSTTQVKKTQAEVSAVLNYRTEPGTSHVCN